MKSAQSSDATKDAPYTHGPSWHSLTPEHVLKNLQARAGGLSDSEAATRRSRYGSNTIPDRPPVGIAILFLRQFKSPLIYVLLAAGIVSLSLSHWGDAGFILGVLILNAVIGTVQEWRAETGVAALRKILRVFTLVIRNGVQKKMGSEELVPGDVVLLGSGDAVPADLRLLSSHSLRLDESLLTGESTAVEKSADVQFDANVGLADRTNLAHAGTLVLAGRGTGVVCETGIHTAVGRIGQLIAGKQTSPPLVLRLEQFARRLTTIMSVVIVAIALSQLIQGAELAYVFFFAVALAVAAIPEGLPVAITIALSIASRRMSLRNVIVRLLPAVEGLGACTLIATDKTGTLTLNRLTAKRVILPDGQDFEIGGEGLETTGAVLFNGEVTTPNNGLKRLGQSGVLANEAELHHVDDATEVSGDMLDVALLVLAEKLELTRSDLCAQNLEVDVIHYESAARFAASFRRSEDQTWAHVKGAPETVLTMCGEGASGRLSSIAQDLATEGYRVIALASAPVDDEALRTDPHQALTALEFLGFVGLIDPVRPEVPGAIRRCHSAGVDVRMITGDHPATGLAIARQLGIANAHGDVVTGTDLASLDEAERLEKIREAKVFARVEPEQKTIIVRGLQNAGHFVAVTGDGVNDAPALQAAHIGVAMGASGTDVARGAADLIIADDNFASIVNGIEEGRGAYDNIRKVIWLLISTGAAEIVLFLAAAVTGLPMPLTPVQLLWLNLVSNGIQDVAMVFEKREPGLMARRPRSPNEAIFNRTMIEKTLLSGAVMGLVAFAVYYWLHANPSITPFATHNLLLLLMVLFENVHVFNCRSEERSAFTVPLSANPFLIGAVIAAQGLHIAAMYTPGLREVLDVEPVSLAEWTWLLGLAMMLLFTVEIYKWMHRTWL